MYNCNNHLSHIFRNQSKIIIVLYNCFFSKIYSIRFGPQCYSDLFSGMPQKPQLSIAFAFRHVKETHIKAINEIMMFTVP